MQSWQLRISRETVLHSDHKTKIHRATYKFEIANTLYLHLQINHLTYKNPR
jgi:hypothetical protein